MDYAGNTKKERQKSEKVTVTAEKKIEKVVTGEIVQKPKSMGRKFKDIFFGGDAKQAAVFVTADVLLPALRNLVVDMVTKGAERLVYGESSYRRGRGINYNAQYTNNPIRRPLDPRDQRMPLNVNSRTRQNRHEINDIVIPTKEEAELVVERLNDIFEKYDVVSLADLYDLLGLQTSHIDNKWGWTYIGNIPIRQIRQGYLLELPLLEEI